MTTNHWIDNRNEVSYGFVNHRYMYIIFPRVSMWPQVDRFFVQFSRV